MENNLHKTLNDVLAAFDAPAKRFDSHELVAALIDLPEEERAKPEAHHEWTAFMLQPNDSDSTFGGYFGPQVTFADANGNPLYMPALSDITPEAVLYWEQRYKTSANPLMRMRYAGLVWDFKRRIVNSNYDTDLYRTYVDSMLAVCNNDLASHPVVTTNILERLFNIAKKQDDDLAKAKDALRSFEQRHAVDHAVRYWACQFQLMTQNGKFFTQDEKDTLVRQHEDRMMRLATPDANGKIDVWTLNSQCELLAEYYNHNQQKEEIRRVLKVAEEAFMKNFDPNNPMQKLGILEQLHHKYVHFGLHDEAARLLKEIQAAGTAAVDALTPHQFEFQIPPEVYDQADAMFGAKAESDEKRWGNFVIYFIPRKDMEERSLAEAVKHYPFRYMVATNLMDYKGHTNSIIGSYEHDPEGNLVMHITEKMNLGTYFLGIAIHKMREQGLMITDRIMHDIVEPCPLFEAKSHPVIRQALDFLFNDESVIACHLLVPQIEVAIRNLVEMSGFSILKAQKQVEKGFQMITLDDLLRKEPVETAFTSDGAMYLRLVLTDQRSLNIRNNLCHGNLPPDSFNSGVAARLLHVLIMIGMVRFEETDK